MNKCPRCNAPMMALFQIPKCEHCELGGHEIKTHVYGASLKAIWVDDHSDNVCVFQDPKHAREWVSVVRNSYLFVKCARLESDTFAIRWDDCGPNHPNVPNAQYITARLYSTQKRALAAPKAARGVPTFYILE